MSPKYLLVQLHRRLKPCPAPQLGPQTQRRPHVSWLKRGERLDYSGRKRNKSVYRERRLKGRKKKSTPKYKAKILPQQAFENIALQFTSRRSREELERRRAEERARQQAEAQRLIEEMKRREQEEQRRAEEERAQAMREAALLQKQVGN